MLSDLALQYGECIKNFSFVQANVIAKEIFQYINQTIDDKEKERMLSVLLSNIDVWIQRWYAQVLLPIHEKETLNLLQKISKEHNLCGIQSELLLYAWKLTSFRSDKIASLFPHVNPPSEGQMSIITDFNSLLLLPSVTVRDVLQTQDFDDQYNIGLKTINAIFSK